MPDGEITFTDLVRGDITFQTEFVPDYALARANGDPLYTLDGAGRRRHDADHPRPARRGPASPAPRARWRSSRRSRRSGWPRRRRATATCPTCMGQGNKKLSKRDPEAHMELYREQGFLPEGLLNYLALLGWSIAADRDVFTLDEMVDAFDIKDVNPNPARFDLKKAEAINTSQLRAAAAGRDHRALPAVPGEGRRPRPGGPARPSAPRPGHAAGGRAHQQAHRGRRHARLPLRGRGGLHPHRRRSTTPVATSSGVVRRAVGHRDLEHRRDRRGARARPWSRSAASSRAWRSVRCGSRRPAGRSARRSSSRSSCWAANARWPGCATPCLPDGLRCRAGRPRGPGLPPDPPPRSPRRVAPDPGRRPAHDRRLRPLAVPVAAAVRRVAAGHRSAGRRRAWTASSTSTTPHRWGWPTSTWCWPPPSRSPGC